MELPFFSQVPLIALIWQLPLHQMFKLVPLFFSQWEQLGYNLLSPQDTSDTISLPKYVSRDKLTREVHYLFIKLIEYSRSLYIVWYLTTISLIAMVVTIIISIAFLTWINTSTIVACKLNDRTRCQKDIISMTLKFKSIFQISNSLIFNFPNFWFHVLMCCVLFVFTHFADNAQ